MSWMIGTTFQTCTATATSWASGYSPDWLPLLDDHPLLRSWRSVGLSQQVITCTFGSLVTLGGILIQNLNCSQIKLARSTNGGSTYVDLLTGSGTLSTITVGQHWQYRRFCQALNVQATHIQLTIPVQTPTDNAAYYEVASLVFPVFAAWPRSPRPGMRQVLSRDYVKSGNSVAKAGPFSLSQDISLVLKSDQVSTLKTFALHGADKPFAVFENQGDTSAGRIMRYADSFTFESSRLYSNVSNLSFKELV